jgi:hypothetical protein
VLAVEEDELNEVLVEEPVEADERFEVDAEVSGAII